MIDKTGITENVTLWRYLDFAEFMSIITDAGIVLLRPDFFEDPLECFCPGANSRECQKIAKGVNVLCWHMNNNESEAMWRLYSKNYKNAVAIKTDKNTLLKIFPDQYELYSINYIDYKKELPKDNQYYLYKRLSFSHEKELRIVLKHKNGKKAPGPYMHLLGDEGLKELLHTVYVSPYAPARFDFMFSSVMEKYGIVRDIVYSNELHNGIRI